MIRLKSREEKFAMGETSKEEKYQKSPYVKAGFLSKATYWWLWDLFLKAYKRPLKEDDVYNPPDFLTCDYNVNTFQSKWDELRTKNKEGSLFWLLLKHFKYSILTGFAIWTIAEFSIFASILTLRFLVEDLIQSNDKNAVMPWALTGVVVVLSFITAIMTTNGKMFTLIVEMRIKILLSTMIYRKALKLSTREFGKISSGHIVSLMSADVEAFNLGVLTLYGWYITPIMFLAISIYEGLDLGPSVFLGLVIICLAILIQYKFTSTAGKLRLKLAKQTDKRILLMNEIIKAMKVVKMYCWEKPYADFASKIRRNEMAIQLHRSILVALGICFIDPVIKFALYILIICHVLTGNTLTAMQSYTLIAFVKQMGSTFIKDLSISAVLLREMNASSARIKAFLLSEECIEENESHEQTNYPICFTDYSGQWTKEEQEDAGFSLKSLHMEFQKGDAIAIVGKVGSGKSTLLMACLNELQTIRGKCHVQGSVAYAPQEPWIMSETVRDNILFGEIYDKERYEAIIQACALNKDLSLFPFGDQTLVGERGLTLSGGQKARISLARAVYQDADIYLLDDPLSAVDVKVGKKLFFDCINGLLKNKLRLVVTHQLHFLPFMDQVILLDKGTCVRTGSYAEVTNLVQKYVEDEKKENNSTQAATFYKEDENGNGINELFTVDKDDDKMNRKDKNEQGSVAGDIYLKYLVAGRGPILLPVFLFLMTIALAAAILQDWVLVHWNKDNLSYTNGSAGVKNKFLEWLNPREEFDDKWYIQTIGLGILINFVFYFTSFIVFVYMCKTAGERLYNQMFERLMKAPSHFFETNPVGQVLNRFSRDTTFMDVYLVFLLVITLNVTCPYLPDVVYVLVINPWCMIPVIAYIIIIGILYRIMVPCMRESKRIESSLRTPIFSQLSSTLDGITVIRAMKKQKEFLVKVNSCMDQHSSAWFNYICAQRGVTFVFDVIAAVLVTASLIIMMLGFDTESGDKETAGLAFFYLPGLIVNLSLGFMYGAQVGTMMTSVERIYQYSKLEQEAPDHTTFRPPVNWPGEGKISLRDMSLYYRGQTNSALGPLDMTIQSGEKIGIIGRTGAGKSSLIVALLRMVEPNGRVVIDGINIQDIGLAALRGCISVIPQVQLKQNVLRLPGQLFAKMGENGSNLSVGQKQLLCLARAILRKNRIVLIDEATADVDNRTDAIIQRTLKEFLTGATVLTIAHRLNTLIETDRIMVLDHGKLVQFDHSYHLLQNESGIFYGMVNALGQENMNFFRKATKEHLDQHCRQASYLMTSTFVDEVVNSTWL